MCTLLSLKLALKQLLLKWKCSILLNGKQSNIVEEVKNYPINLLKIFTSLLLVSRFVRSSDDNWF